MDESGAVIAWLDVSDVRSADSLGTFRKRRYVFRVDDVASGASLHAVPLPELPGLMSPSSCDAWLATARAGTHGRAIEEVERIVERYTFRRLHPDWQNEHPTPEDQTKAALDLLRRPSDPKGDWSTLPPLGYQTMQDDRPRPGTLFSISTAQGDGPSITSWPLTVALRCRHALRDVECVGPEDLLVFRAGTRAVRLAVRLSSKENPAVFCDAQSTITSLDGISPRRRILLLAESTGFWAEEGHADEDCFGLSMASRFTVFRFDP